MAHAATISNVSLERYLGDPEFETYEYRDGEVRDSVVGTPKHATIQMAVGSILRTFLRKTRRGWVMAEARCRLPLAGRTRFYLPDVCVVLAETDAQDKRYLARAPELVVEIQSPDDSLAAVLRKIDDYFEAGTQLAWVLLPEERTALVCRPGGEPQRLGPAQMINADPVLKGFEATVADLFE